MGVFCCFFLLPSVDSGIISTERAAKQKNSETKDEHAVCAKRSEARGITKNPKNRTYMVEYTSIDDTNID